MAVYVYRDGRMVDKATGEPMNSGPLEGPFPCPQVQPDIEPFVSPASGKVVGGRRQKRDDLKATGCIDANDFNVCGGKMRNERFAKKRGLEHLLDG